MGEIGLSMNQQILVTGGCGFIGANLVRALINEGYGVRVLDNLSVGKPNAVEGMACELVIGDIRNNDILDATTQGIDAVVHLAAKPGVIDSINDPRTDFQVNAEGTLAVLQACVKNQVPSFVFASTGAVLGEAQLPLNELQTPKPLSPYGASKLAGEAYCSAFYGSFGLKTVALRFSNVYGPFSGHKKSAVAEFIRRAHQKMPLSIFGDGNQTRDFIFVGDLVDAIVAALRTEGVGGEVFQIASGQPTSVNELVRLLGDAVGWPLEVEHKPGQRGEVRFSYANIDKAKQRLGYEPRVGLADGLHATYKWFVDNWRDLPKVMSSND